MGIRGRGLGCWQKMRIVDENRKEVSTRAAARLEWTPLERWILKGSSDVWMQIFGHSKTVHFKIYGTFIMTFF